MVLLSGTSVPNRQSEGHHTMRTKDSELVQRIKSYIEDQCEQRGGGEYLPFEKQRKRWELERVLCRDTWSI